jgi:hypothetical protein
VHREAEVVLCRSLRGSQQLLLPNTLRQEARQGNLSLRKKRDNYDHKQLTPKNKEKKGFHGLT